MSETTQMMLGLGLGIAIMVILVMKTKIHSFMALLIAALVAGLIGGMPIATITLENGTTNVGVINAIKDGFGNTLKSTGIIIGLGVMMGAILEKSGAAERLAYTFIKKVGKNNEEWALTLTGWVVSIPVFADSAQVIFAPLTKGISRVSGKSVVGLALAMSAGLQLTHCLVPPTPGPTTAASMLGVDVGQMIIAGTIISLPMIVAAVYYSKWVGKQIYQIPLENGGYEKKEYKEEYLKAMDNLDELLNGDNLPSFAMSVAPIAVPLFLILSKTFIDLLGYNEGSFYPLVQLFGEPIIALAIGAVIATYGLASDKSQKEVMSIFNDSFKDVGIILLITGAGGALGNVIRVSGIGDALGQVVLTWPIPAVLIPVIIAALMRIALGSATVAITTAASLTAPMIGVLGIPPLLAAQAACIGAISFSYFNDSGFWVFNGMFGVTELKDQLRCKTAISLIMAGIGVVELLLATFVINTFFA